MKNSKIEWCDMTWNPITGCRHGCPYCYAKGITNRFTGDMRANRLAKADYEEIEAADRSENIYVVNRVMKTQAGNSMPFPFGFEPTFYRYRMQELDQAKTGRNIFVGSMADLFGNWVPDAWIYEIFEVCRMHGQHNYLFLTKNPERYERLKLPDTDNMFYGTSVTKEAEIERIHRLPAGKKTFISIEPILENINAKRYIDSFTPVDWIIIGAQTGNKPVKPYKEWIKDITAVADLLAIPVFMKDSLIPTVGEENMIREYPPELMRKTVSKKHLEMWFENCNKCGAFGKKREMVNLFAKTKRGKYGTQMGYICRDCFKEICNMIHIDAESILNDKEEK